jgi:subtilisin family serine protease
MIGNFLKKGERVMSENQGKSDLPLQGQRELIVIAKQQAGLTTTKDGITSATGANVAPLRDLLSSEGISLQPLFGASEEGLRNEAEAMRSSAGADTPASLDLIKLSLFYRAIAPDDRLEALADSLRKQDVVDAAYVKPPVELAASVPRKAIGKIFSKFMETSTPNFTDRQIYLNPAPEGIDARYAWTIAGGRGDGIKIIDIESSWNFEHEDLAEHKGGIIAGVDKSSTDHGTAVLGVMGGDNNDFGVTGICSNAHISAVSHYWPQNVFDYISLAPAIKFAADRLKIGDIILLEVHMPGPRYEFKSPSGQKGYIAVEWWPDIYVAIGYAINRHIIVVEAAGNGYENLDDPIYDKNPKNSFPSWWQNPFRRSRLDSGAIVVGAGSPPAGVHDRDESNGEAYIDRSRLGFSNYGKMVDAQGWGREVTSTGYGNYWKDESDPDNTNRWYTDTFSGTSSASPIVAGALACVQGILKRKKRNPLSHGRARKLLRETGSPQQDAPDKPKTQRIGNRPDLRKLISEALGKRTDVEFAGLIPAGKKKCYQSPGWPAGWHVKWTVAPSDPQSNASGVKWNVKAEKASDKEIVYSIYITNDGQSDIRVEGCYSVQGES